MYLPEGYQSVSQYFHDTMLFLHDYQWVYRYPMTGLLVHNVLNQIPAEWKVAFECMSQAELLMLSSGCAEEHWPTSLIQFLAKCKRLQLRNTVHTQSWNLSKELCRGLSVKKQHEVSRMASLVHQRCQKLDIHKVLDVGSGLGYLDFVLHLDFGYHVLGLEAVETNIAKSSQKISSICGRCEAISFHLCNVSKTTYRDICQVMNKSLSDTLISCSCNGREDGPVKIQKEKQVDSTEVCLIGLHACGDLTSTAVDMFLQIPRMRLMVLVPCCYHKIAMCSEEQKQEDSCSNFSTFPRSETLKSVLQKEFEGYKEYLDRPFLRLASQESSCRWQHWTEKDHQLHSENLMARAVFELGVHRLGLTLKKKFRRCIRKTQRKSIETFLEDVMERYDFLLSDGTTVTKEKHEELLLELRTLWLEHHKVCQLAGALTGLQAAMQAAVESIVLVDTVTYIQEQENQLSVDIMKVMDDVLSPRCRAIVVQKLR